LEKEEKSNRGFHVFSYEPKKIQQNQVTQQSQNVAGAIRRTLVNTTRPPMPGQVIIITLQGFFTYPTKREKENHLQNAIFGGI